MGCSGPPLRPLPHNLPAAEAAQWVTDGSDKVEDFSSISHLIHDYPIVSISSLRLMLEDAPRMDTIHKHIQASINTCIFTVSVATWP